MSPAFGRYCQATLGRSGTASLEFALVAIPFVFILIAGMDLGRYFITQHSLRTLTSEAVRATLLVCNASNIACPLPSGSKTAVWAKVPFLSSTSQNASLAANQTAPDSTTGVRTITATVNYQITFILPAWTGLNGTITETTSLSY
jgi:Flp pilus assembly protein TadG